MVGEIMSKTAAKPNTSSPQPKPTGAATNGGAGAKEKPTALYVVGACPVLHDHEVYQPDDELELTSAEAARLAGKVTAASASDDTAR